MKEKRKRKRDDEVTDLPQRAPMAPLLSLAPPRKPLPPHQFVLAPMVGGSELAFRLLARRHGAQLCYTPMMHSAEFIAPSKTERGIGQLEIHPDDTPLVAHFSGNDPATCLAAAKRAERCSGVVAVDLNLGCPQRSAHSGHFGAFLCVDPENRQLVLRIVAHLARHLIVPVFCKIRLLDEGIDETVRFAQQLEAAGCALLAVHGRYRGSPMHRRDGPAHLEQIHAVKQGLTIPVITNGNVRNAAELVESLVHTGCDGVMSAEGALDDPAIFDRAAGYCRAERKRLKREIGEIKGAAARDHAQDQEANLGRPRESSRPPEELPAVPKLRAAKARLKALPRLPRPGGQGTGAHPEPLHLAEAYLGLVRVHPPTGEKGEVTREILMAHAIFHLRRLCRDLLSQYELLPILASCRTLDAAADVMRRCREYAEGTREFVAGAEAAQADASEREARQLANAARRAEFVARMRDKARKEGQVDVDCYLRVGREPPTPADLAHARSLAGKRNGGGRNGKGKQADPLARWWREHFGQHCQGFHLDGVCPHKDDPKGCGFLHGERE